MTVACQTTGVNNVERCLGSVQIRFYVYATKTSSIDMRVQELILLKMTSLVPFPSNGPTVYTTCIVMTSLKTVPDPESPHLYY